MNPINPVPPPRPVEASISNERGKPTFSFQGWLRSLWNMVNGTLNVGFTGSITTAKLTPGGTTGSMTFQNGVVVSQVAAT